MDTIRTVFSELRVWHAPTRFLKWGALIWVAALALAQPAVAAKLQDKTVQAFKEHVRKTEDGFEKRVRENRFLWVDESQEAMKQVRAGQVVVAPVVGKGELHVPDGLIHDWVGAIFIPNATMEQVLAAQKDYNNHKNTHKPEVLDSKLLSQKGNDFKIYLRVSKSKATVTAVLNTEHEVHYTQVDEKRWEARSYSTRITQVKNAGERDEKEMPEGDDSGYLWRLNSYWRYVEHDGGVYAECEAVSLTRDVPWIFSPIIVPIIRGLPRESLKNTLESTRKAALIRAVERSNNAPRQ